MFRDTMTRLFLLLALLVSTSLHADHEIDHRYSVRGYLVDGQDRPIAGAIVIAQLAGERETGRTDDTGYYNLTMHVHDSDIGQVIRLRAGEVAATIRMQAETGNSHTERIHWASFVDGQLREDSLGQFKMPGWAWVLIAVTGLVGLLAGGVKLQKAGFRRRRAAARSESTQQPSKKRNKEKRSRSKKRRG